MCPKITYFQEKSVQFAVLVFYWDLQRNIPTNVWLSVIHHFSFNGSNNQIVTKFKDLIICYSLIWRSSVRIFFCTIFTLVSHEKWIETAWGIFKQISWAMMWGTSRARMIFRKLWIKKSDNKTFGLIHPDWLLKVWFQLCRLSNEKDLCLEIKFWFRKVDCEEERVKYSCGESKVFGARLSGKPWLILNKKFLNIFCAADSAWASYRCLGWKLTGRFF